MISVQIGSHWRSEEAWSERFPETQQRNALRMGENKVLLLVIKTKKEMVVLVPRAPIPLACAVKVILVSHSEEIILNEKQHKDTEFMFFGTRMRVVEDEECKRCPEYYQSTGYYSEENGGVP